ncbi:MAG: Flp pilus assembly protein CpaB [Candidatus Omnitrophota bacterium]
MNKRLLSIIIAVVMALLAVVMVNAYLNREKQKYQIQLQEAYVVVATEDIPKGATILPRMVKPVQFPVKYMQPTAAQNPNAVVGKIAVTDIVKDEQILATKLTTVRRVEDSLAVRLPQGKRAFTIDIPSLMAVAGDIKSGDYIDVIGSFPYTQNIDGKAVTEKVSVTLFQKILVMEIKRSEDSKLIFTLALTPQEAAILSYATGQGSLRFILRQPLDTTIESVPPIEANALWQYILSTLGQQLVQAQQPDNTKRVEQAQPEAPPTLEIYRGSKRQTMDLDR